MRTILKYAAAVALTGALALAAASPSQARHGRNAAIIGGFAAGAAIGGLAAANGGYGYYYGPGGYYYYPPDPYAYGPGPVYVAPAPVYRYRGGGCWHDTDRDRGFGYYGPC